MPCDLCDTHCYILTNFGREPCRACDGGYILTPAELGEDTPPEPDGYWYDGAAEEGDRIAPDLRLDTGNLYPWTWPDLRYQPTEDDRFFATIG